MWKQSPVPASSQVPAFLRRAIGIPTSFSAVLNPADEWNTRYRLLAPLVFKSDSQAFHIGMLNVAAAEGDLQGWRLVVNMIGSVIGTTSQHEVDAHPPKWTTDLLSKHCTPLHHGAMYARPKVVSWLLGWYTNHLPAALGEIIAGTCACPSDLWANSPFQLAVQGDGRSMCQPFCTSSSTCCGETNVVLPVSILRVMLRRIPIPHWGLTEQTAVFEDLWCDDFAGALLSALLHGAPRVFFGTRLDGRARKRQRLDTILVLGRHQQGEVEWTPQHAALQDAVPKARPRPLCEGLATISRRGLCQQHTGLGHNDRFVAHYEVPRPSPSVAPPHVAPPHVALEYGGRYGLSGRRCRHAVAGVLEKQHTTPLYRPGPALMRSHLSGASLCQCRRSSKALFTQLIL
ncbi:hypothetical protein FN846DRAFT_886203 [Sphaerosporella brunnea]|uniref:Uncharacterized protein n=1 Tax=Sphaerosporella brunnea TaxID=1250544 RepID=A0A5J5FB08_9PEZI|nr:hypothetical protein FN846DRAFT_886203 [Sphaerosporella brunnea]